MKYVAVVMTFTCHDDFPINGIWLTTQAKWDDYRNEWKEKLEEADGGAVGFNAPDSGDKHYSIDDMDEFDKCCEVSPLSETEYGLMRGILGTDKFGTVPEDIEVMEEEEDEE